MIPVRVCVNSLSQGVSSLRAKAQPLETTFTSPLNHIVVRPLGCFKDTGRRAIPQMDGRDILVRDFYRRRKDAIKKCALVAARYGYKVFSVQHQGWCAAGPKAHLTYWKYGPSRLCRNGKGGPWSNDVYSVSGLWYLLSFPLAASYIFSLAFPGLHAFSSFALSGMNSSACLALHAFPPLQPFIFSLRLPPVVCFPAPTAVSIFFSLVAGRLYVFPLLQLVVC